MIFKWNLLNTKTEKMSEECLSQHVYIEIMKIKFPSTKNIDSVSACG